MEKADDPNELRRQIEQARRLADVAGPVLAANLMTRVEELKARLAKIERTSRCYTGRARF